MIWFLERGVEPDHKDLLVCEIRRGADDQGYEFEVAGSDGRPTTQRFESPSDLIDNYLSEQARLMSLGWRPVRGDVTPLE